MSTNIRNVARAVIINDGQVLLCRAVSQGHYFFPGGGIEFGEKAEVTLRREMLEEAGAVLQSATFIGTAENVFVMDGVRAHEVISVFAVQLAQNDVLSKESHIEFLWLPVARLGQEKVLPLALTEAVVKWLNDKTTFWVSNVE